MTSNAPAAAPSPPHSPPQPRTTAAPPVRHVSTATADASGSAPPPTGNASTSDPALPPDLRQSTRAMRAAAQAPEPAPPPNAVSTEHDSLKYHLLGPSLTKAGQDTVDQQKVSEIIYNASKGSKFFNNEEAKDKNLTEKIAKILARKAQLEKLDLSSDLRRADDYIAELELGRDLSQTVVHLDCDAFYAAVEELDRPELKEVPMAVGKGVLTTCNYHARKFGCRSGMAGFVAMKLCPQLICVPMNFAKYMAKAQEVREVLALYDPNFESASCDEAYLNITQYCEDHHMGPEEVVSQLRAEVFEKAKITVSAGIAANAKLAKIGSNKNKPNGQFFLPSDRQTIMEFMKTMPTRKVNGIGRVFERELDAIGVKTCGDIYAQRSYLAQLFGQKGFQFLMQCYLGLGRTKIQQAEESHRKSVGTETTFRELGSADALREKLRWVADELEGDLKRTEYKGKTLCIKVKLATYEVHTRQTTPPFAVQRADDLYKYSLPMLEKLMKEIPNMKLRLMGLRVTHIISTKKPGIDFFGRNRLNVNTPTKKRINRTGGEWEIWPEQDFEQAAAQERNDEMNELEQLSQEYERTHLQPDTGAPSPPTPNQWICPICTLPQPPDDSTFNTHIDFCLSRATIKEAVKSSVPAGSSATTSTAASATISTPAPAQPFFDREPTTSKTPPSKKSKRARGRDESHEDARKREKRRAFFGVG